MSFTILLQNNELIEYLKNIKKEEQNIFINKLLQLGFKKYNEFQNKEYNEFQNKKYNEFQNKENNEFALTSIINDKFHQIYSLVNEIKLENQLILNKNTIKGSLGERTILDFFYKNNYQIEDTSTTPHSGDLKLYLSEINQNVLIEIKNYKNTVDQKQIDKFYYDIKYTGMQLGIFISIHSKIVNQKFPIEWKITDDNKILIFIYECSEEYLYLALFSLISIYKNKIYSPNFQLTKYTELFNDIKYLSLQKESINKLKNDLLSIHDSYTSSILTLYNNICIFDNNFSYIINKIYNKLDKLIIDSEEYDTDIIIKIESIYPQHKELLEMIISDLIIIYKLDIIDNKKIIIVDNNAKYIGEIKILKTTLNLILQTGLEIKNITKSNWLSIRKLL